MLYYSHINDDDNNHYEENFLEIDEYPQNHDIINKQNIFVINEENLLSANSANNERTDGVSIYNFHTLRTYKDGQTNKFSYKQIKNGIKAWTKRVLPTEVKAFDRIYLEAPKNANLSGDILSFDKVNDAKFYVIYQTNGLFTILHNIA